MSATKTLDKLIGHTRDSMDGLLESSKAIRRLETAAPEYRDTMVRAKANVAAAEKELRRVLQDLEDKHRKAS